MTHIPVLLHEVLTVLDLSPGLFVIDGTADGGGYTKAMLSKLGTTGTLLALDWDQEMVKNLRAELKVFEREGLHINIRSGNFKDLPEILKQNDLPKADALVLDLGFSSEHLESSGRGFSFLRDEPLLMTYNDESESVRSILKKLTLPELEQILRDFGEERFARRIAEAIHEQKKIKSIETSGELARIVISATPKSYEHGRIHPATRTFLALRIYANQELENIEAILKKLSSVLRPGGRVAIVSFHSSEDRIVKHFFQSAAKEEKLKIITKKPIIATDEEVRDNPRARSAKLRAAILL